MTESPDTPRYGGRALRNGVMMVGPGAVAVAIRQPGGEIVTAVEPFTMPGAWSKNIPFVRGLVSFAGLLKLARTSTRLENKLNAGRSKTKAILPQLAPGLGAAVADRATREISKRLDARVAVPFETAAGMIFPYIAFGLSGRFPGVRELWRYHGAEHKAVHTAEAGLDLTPENAHLQSRVHPRCGTVLAFWAILGGSLTKALLRTMPDGKKKTAVGAVSGPITLAAAYEVVRLGWQLRESRIARTVFAPAWNSQRMTTLEPDTQELEVALAAIQTVMEFEPSRA